MCACPPGRTHALIYGNVRSAAGQPVAGAQVQAAVFRSVCGEGMSEVNPDTGPVSSDPAGAYRLRFHSVLGPQAVCVRVNARVSGATDSAAVNAALTLRNEEDEPDSVRVDLVLQ